MAPGVLVAAVESLAFLGISFHQFSIAGLFRAGDAGGFPGLWFCVLALRISGAGQKFTIGSPFNHHRPATDLALFSSLNSPLFLNDYLTPFTPMEIGRIIAVWETSTGEK